MNDELMTSTSQKEIPLKFYSIETCPYMPKDVCALVSGKWPNQQIVAFNSAGILWHGPVKTEPPPQP